MGKTLLCFFLRALPAHTLPLLTATTTTVTVNPTHKPNSSPHRDNRYLLGVTDEERQQRRDQILSTSVKDFKEFGEAIACVSGEAARVVAVTSADKAAQVLEEKPGFWEIKKVL